MERSETARLLTAAAAFTPSIPADDERAVNAWHSVIGDLPFIPASRAVQAYYRESSWPITPAEIVKRAKAMQPPAIAKHLQCPKHPDEHEWNCPHCPRQIGAANPDVMAQVRELAQQAQLDTKARNRERAAALQRKADDAARRAAEKLERKRQKDAYAAREGA